MYIDTLYAIHHAGPGLQVDVEMISLCTFFSEIFTYILTLDICLCSCFCISANSTKVLVVQLRMFHYLLCSHKIRCVYLILLLQSVSLPGHCFNKIKLFVSVLLALLPHATTLIRVTIIQTLCPMFVQHGKLNQIIA